MKIVILIHNKPYKQTMENIQSMTNCVFCGRQAVRKNKQNFPVCITHKEDSLPDMKCVCGEFLTIKESKYGAFFLCADCGHVSLKKAMSVNEVQLKQSKDKTPKEITMRSDEVDFL
ncbi:hypothetical protein ACFLTH_05555 [Bacteroidota bacterium]